MLAIVFLGGAGCSETAALARAAVHERVAAAATDGVSKPKPKPQPQPVCFVGGADNAARERWRLCPACRDGVSWYGDDLERLASDRGGVGRLAVEEDDGPPPRAVVAERALVAEPAGGLLRRSVSGGGTDQIAPATTGHVAADCVEVAQSPAGESTARSLVGERTAPGVAIGDGTTADGMTGDGMTGDGVTGVGVTGDGLTGDGLTGDGLTGDGVTGDGLTGDGLTGDGVTGDGVTGDGVTGDGVTGDGLTGDGLTGDGVTGDGMAEAGATEAGVTGAGATAGVVAGAPVRVESASDASRSNGAGGAPLIDLRTASSEDLLRLPRIGPARARAILSLREKGLLRRVRDLRRVRGIGPQTLRVLGPLVRISPGGGRGDCGVAAGRSP